MKLGLGSVLAVFSVEVAAEAAGTFEIVLTPESYEYFYVYENNKEHSFGTAYFGTPTQVPESQVYFLYSTEMAQTITRGPNSCDNTGYFDRCFDVFTPADSTTYQSAQGTHQDITEVKAGDGLDFIGEMGNDRVCLASTNDQTCVEQLDIFVFSEETNAKVGVSGVLGLSPNFTGTDPSFMDALFDEGNIGEKQVSFHFNDASQQQFQSKVTFGGGPEEDSYSGDWQEYKVDLARFGSSNLWMLDSKQLVYGDDFFIGGEKIVGFSLATGKEGITIPYDYYDEIAASIHETNADWQCDAVNGSCFSDVSTCEQYYRDFESIKIQFDETKIFQIKPEGYLRSNWHSHKCVLPVKGWSNQQIELGQIFFENYVAVFDYDAKSVKLAVNANASDRASIEENQQGLSSAMTLLVFILFIIAVAAITICAMKTCFSDTSDQSDRPKNRTTSITARIDQINQHESGVLIDQERPDSSLN